MRGDTLIHGICWKNFILADVLLWRDHDDIKNENSNSFLQILSYMSLQIMIRIWIDFLKKVCIDFMNAKRIQDIDFLLYKCLKDPLKLL